MKKILMLLAMFSTLSLANDYKNSVKVGLSISKYIEMKKEGNQAQNGSTIPENYSIGIEVNHTFKVKELNKSTFNIGLGAEIMPFYDLYAGVGINLLPYVEPKFAFDGKRVKHEIGLKLGLGLGLADFGKSALGGLIDTIAQQEPGSTTAIVYYGLTKISPTYTLTKNHFTMTLELLGFKGLIMESNKSQEGKKKYRMTPIYSPAITMGYAF